MESTDKNKKFSEVVIVEGRDDTKRLKLFFPELETIETNGSEISQTTLAKIKKLAELRPLIILTDPDFNGERIRRKVAEVAPNAKHAFITRDEAVPQKTHGSLGVEHASKETLTKALANLHGQSDNPAVISKDEYLELGLMTGPVARKRREFLGQQLGIGYANAKQFLKRLQMFAVTKTEIMAELQKVDKS